MPEASRIATTGETVLVVAHPDDETLWFSSVLAEVARIVVCFRDVPSDPRCTAGRRRLFSDLPLRNLECLGLTEAGVYEAADWRMPRPVAYGLELPHIGHSASRGSVNAYRVNFERLVEELRGRLAGAGVVYTHNPWGEYGHEEHVQVFRAVESLQQEFGFEIRFGTYVSEKSYQLFFRYLARLPDAAVTLPTDRSLAQELRVRYERNDCWTWYAGYVWPTEETFIRWRGEPELAGRQGALIRVNMIRFGWNPGDAGRGHAVRRILGRLYRFGRSHR